jgi:NDMA-dependent alcohol dehydrogenase
MKTRGAILRGSPGKYEVADLELDAPRQGEVTVKVAAAGLCHSDDHAATGDMPFAMYPFCGGHEGAGVVVEVGPNTPELKQGDHVVFSFLPACGLCRWCATGHQSLCDKGALITYGARFDDPTSYRFSLPDGTPVGQQSGLGTFAEYTTVDLRSVVKIDNDLPLDKMCLLGCGVVTGWGSAVNAAGVGIGDTVIVIGIGGVGINAVQGAAHAGASHVIAVDPVAFKRTSALALGATHAFATIEEAADLARSLTNGQGADSAVITVGVTDGDHVASGFGAVRKAGTVVVTGAGPGLGIPVSILELVFYQKRIQGSLYGSGSPTYDIPRLAQLYREGNLKLDELITTRYSLDQVARGFEDMHAGTNIRGVIVFD